MAHHFYEHHIDIRKNKICPFKVAFLKDYRPLTCNWHENVEIMLITEGEGVIFYGSEEKRFKKGDIVIINSGIIHRTYCEKGFESYFIIIDESFAKENGLSAVDRIFTPIFRSDNTTRLFEAVVKEEKAKRKDTPVGAAKLRLTVLELLIDICEEHSEIRNKKEKTEKASEQYVKKVMVHIGDRYAEELTLEGLAQLCGVTKHHLAREFKAYTGMTVLTYLNLIRCKNAEGCLLAGASVTETAVECGFESISYFSRTYKKLMGVSPSGVKK